MRTITSQLHDFWWALTVALARPRRDHGGQSLVEYALLIAVIGVVLIPVTQMLKEGLVAAFLNQNAALGIPAATATPIH